MISALILAGLLSIQDPSNDAVGNGTLVPPRSQDFVVGTLDVTEFSVLDETSLTVQLKFASLANPFDRVLGFSFPIIEIYIQDNEADTGATTSLEGSSMVFPKGSFWTHALRLTGDKAELFEWSASGLESTDSVSVFTQDTTLTIRTQIATPKNLTTYGIVGYYTPFSQTGWQNISPNPSPWAYSSLEQQSPVVDVISENPDAQQQAIRQNVIPPIASSSPPNYWIYVMISGLCLAIFGFIVRTRSRVSRNKPALEPQKPDIPIKLPERSVKDVAAFEAFLKMPNSPKAMASHKDSLHTASDMASNEDDLKAELDLPDESKLFQKSSDVQAEDKKDQSLSASSFLDETPLAQTSQDPSPVENPPKDQAESREGSSLSKVPNLRPDTFPDDEDWETESESETVWRKPGELDT